MPPDFWGDSQDVPPDALAEELLGAPQQERVPVMPLAAHPRLKALQGIFPGRVLAVKQQSERRVTEETDVESENTIDLSADLDEPQDDA